MVGRLFGLALRVFHVVAMHQSSSFATVRHVLDSCVFLNMLYCNYLFKYNFSHILGLKIIENLNFITLILGWSCHFSCLACSYFGMLNFLILLNILTWSIFKGHCSLADDCVKENEYWKGTQKCCGIMSAPPPTTHLTV